MQEKIADKKEIKKQKQIKSKTYEQMLLECIEKNLKEDFK